MNLFLPNRFAIQTCCMHCSNAAKVCTLVSLLLGLSLSAKLIAQPLILAGRPSQLDIRQAGNNSLRITLKPLTYKNDFPSSPALSERKFGKASITLKQAKPLNKKAGSFTVVVEHNPLTVFVTRADHLIQKLVFNEDGSVDFDTNNEAILGLGEGGPLPVAEVDWRTLPVEYDRNGRLDSMQPRWQRDAYGSRNPVTMLIGTKGWGLFVASPWVYVDLRNRDKGTLTPWKPDEKDLIPQSEKTQSQVAGKGLPPASSIVPGLYDLFVFDGTNPENLVKDFSEITGPASMPPKWTLGYMQSHRTLDDDRQMLGEIDTFRKKKIPLDAVIFLGTGFTPRGWNTKQPSFAFNPEVFKRDPAGVIADMHADHVKVVVHMVPWDRDKLPTLHGSIPAKAGEQLDGSHIQSYWKEHMPLVKAGVDAFWPDEGDWFNLYERIKRHQLYYQGHLSADPNKRPWSLQRNGYPGIAQWGGWVWSGDTESSWKTLEAQIAVGLNYSLSIGPFWGSDIGGFFPNPELTGELYARWFQFGAFCASFRSHGQTWHVRLPWGWSGNEMGPIESNRNPLQSELNNPSIEPIIKQYDELRYQLLPYNYTLAWQARTNGLPLMRSLWLHYPKDVTAAKTGDEYLWGSEMLIAPVYEKGATSRILYLPEGSWYDWWTNEKKEGHQSVTKEVDLSVMPIYVKAGAIIPVDPVRQYTAEVVAGPTTLKIYSGKDGSFTMYDDDGISMDYLKDDYTLTQFIWNDELHQLTIEPGKTGKTKTINRTFNIQLIPDSIEKEINYTGKKIIINLKK